MAEAYQQATATRSTIRHRLVGGVKQIKAKTVILPQRCTGFGGRSGCQQAGSGSDRHGGVTIVMNVPVSNPAS